MVAHRSPPLGLTQQFWRGYFQVGDASGGQGTADFADWHARHARLRVLSRDANLYLAGVDL